MNWLRAGTAILRVPLTGIASLIDRAQTVTGLWTFDRGTNAPFAVDNSSAAVVTNLDADLLDGNHASAFAVVKHGHYRKVDSADTLTLADGYSLVTVGYFTVDGTLTLAGDAALGVM